MDTRNTANHFFFSMTIVLCETIPVLETNIDALASPQHGTAILMLMLLLPNFVHEKKLENSQK